MRLLWDFIGTEFGSRHQQYEKFYGGASFLVKQNVYRNFDWKRAGRAGRCRAGAAAARRAWTSEPAHAPHAAALQPPAQVKTP